MSNGVAYPQYDVSADGRRFVVTEPITDGPRVVQKWFAEFRDREQN